MKMEGEGIKNSVNLPYFFLASVSPLLLPSHLLASLNSLPALATLAASSYKNEATSWQFLYLDFRSAVESRHRKGSPNGNKLSSPPSCTATVKGNRMDVNTILIADNRDCHRGEYSDCSLLGCDTVYFGRQVSTFLRNLLLPYSEQTNGQSWGKMAAAPSSETLVCSCETYRPYSEELRDGRPGFDSRQKQEISLFQCPDQLWGPNSFL